MHLGLLGCGLGIHCGIWCGRSAADQQCNADTDCQLHQSFGNQSSPLLSMVIKTKTLFPRRQQVSLSADQNHKNKTNQHLRPVFSCCLGDCGGFGNTLRYQPPYSCSNVLFPLRPLICQAVRSPMSRARNSNSSSVWLMARAGVNAARPSKRGSAHRAWW